MKFASRIVLALLAVAAVTAAPALAVDLPAGTTTVGTAGTAAAADTGRSGAGLGAGIAAGLAILGAGIGIGLIGFAALGGIARQPEAAGRIQVNMIVTAALVEGAAIIGLLVIANSLVGKIQ